MPNTSALPRKLAPWSTWIMAQLLFLLLTWVSAINSATAHEVRPAIVELNITQEGWIEARFTLNLEAAMAGIGAGNPETAESQNAPEYDRLRTLSPKLLQAEFNKIAAGFLVQLRLAVDETAIPLKLDDVEVPAVGDVEIPRITTLSLSGIIATKAENLTFGWAQELGDLVVRVRGAPTANSESKVVFAAMLRNGKISDPIPMEGLQPMSGGQIFGEYIFIGFDHILPKGLDHILFVVGLFLLSARFSSLAWQISSFTLAHTITLGLAMAGYISVSPAIVEPLIAASIVYVGVENLMTSKLHRWRPVVVFGFGLLHGLGFAGVLSDIGLQPGNFLAGLIGFNLGVEVGQLTVIAICFLAVGWWFREKSWYRSRITNPLSLMISIIATWWFIERVFL